MKIISRSDIVVVCFAYLATIGVVKSQQQNTTTNNTTEQKPPTTEQPTIAVTEQPGQQILQECNICDIQGSTLNKGDPTDGAPSHLSKSDIPLFLSIAEVSYLTHNMTIETCEDWQEFVNNDYSQQSSLSHANKRCLSYQHWLQYSCCSGITIPLYKCQNDVVNKLFFTPTVDGGLSYNKKITPVSGGLSIDVFTYAHVTDYSISGYGVDGGSIEMVGTIISTWVDERLIWNPNDFGGCKQIELEASHDTDKSDIWVPFRRSTIKTGSPSSKATVLSDGTVTWKRDLVLELSCFEWASMSKYCLYTMSTKDGSLWDGDHINYLLGIPFDDNGGTPSTTGGLVVDNPYIIAGYEIGLFETGMNVEVDKDTGEVELTAQVKLEPLEKEKCLLCAGIEGATISNATVPLSFNEGYIFPAVENLTCREIEDVLLMNTNISDPSLQCYSRMFYTEQCCDNLPKTNDCEDDIRGRIFDKIEDAVVPPEPLDGQKYIEVNVNLELTHILDIDIKSNSLEILVSVELVWTDSRMAWQPFIGQCTTASFRASLDPEATEIWVPEVELMNQIEGTSNFAPSFATVFTDGLVWWRRSGVLKAACDLKGIKYFPFDHPTCSLDFGAPRSPLAHRVNYTVGAVDFSDRLEFKEGEYQEFHVEANLTSITLESESMAVYDNQFIRFTFTFNRAVPYYIWAFVILYIMFTYLSFGMFFLDTQVGERLGFGTGILFVIVAQDITVAEYTPITQRQLWIDNISNASKYFVVFGIVQSIAILYYYFVNDLNGDGVDNEIDFTREKEESQRLVTSTDDAHGDVFETAEEDYIYHTEGGKVQRHIDASAATPGAESKQEQHPLQDSTHVQKQRLELGSTEKRWIKFFLGVVIGSNPSIMKQKVMKLRLIDRLTFFLFFFTYTVFLVVMFILGSVRSGED